MGLNLFYSSGSDPQPGNPVPANFEVIDVYGTLCNCAALIKYPDAINYEGYKILVFKGVNEYWVKAQTSIDPHFTESSYLVARFEPTTRGWDMAVDLVDKL